MDSDDFFRSLALRASEDSALVAVLRRSSSYEPGFYPPAFPYIETYVYKLSDWQRQITYLTASCWAQSARRCHGQAVALAEAARILRYHPSIGSKSIEQRFTALLDADSDELQWRLRHLTNQLTAAEIPIEWGSLLKDLWAWNSRTRYVQIRWARQFWANPPAKNSANVVASTN